MIRLHGLLSATARKLQTTFCPRKGSGLDPNIEHAEREGEAALQPRRPVHLHAVVLVELSLAHAAVLVAVEHVEMRSQRMLRWNF